MPKGWWGEWDSQHGEVEVYNKQREHQGAWDPETGEENEGKQKDERRPTYRRFDAEPDAIKTVESTSRMPTFTAPPAGGVSPATTGSTMTTILIILGILAL